jgi:hypothetical protein
MCSAVSSALTLASSLAMLSLSSASRSFSVAVLLADVVEQLGDDVAQDRQHRAPLGGDGFVDALFNLVEGERRRGAAPRIRGALLLPALALELPLLPLVVRAMFDQSACKQGPEGSRPPACPSAPPARVLQRRPETGRESVFRC